MQKCSHWDHGGSLHFQIQERSQKALVCHCPNSLAEQVVRQALLTPWVWVHAQSSIVQELSIFLQPLAVQILGTSCCAFSSVDRVAALQGIICGIFSQAYYSLLPQILSKTLKIGKVFYTDVKTVQHLVWTKARKGSPESPIKLIESHLLISVKFRSGFNCITSSSGIHRCREALCTNP